MARVRQAQATAIIGGAPLLPELAFDLRGERNKFVRNSDRKANPSDDNNTNNFTSDLTASYEVDFWGGIAAGRDSALQGLRASEDQATVELTLLSNVADRYAQTLAAREQGRVLMRARPLRWNWRSRKIWLPPSSANCRAFSNWPTNS